MSEVSAILDQSNMLQAYHLFQCPLITLRIKRPHNRDAQYIGDTKQVVRLFANVGEGNGQK